MKGFEIKHPLLGENKLVLKLSGIFGNPKLFLNDRKVFQKYLFATGLNVVVVVVFFGVAMIIADLIGGY